jgi:hypothetical protein
VLNPGKLVVAQRIGEKEKEGLPMMGITKWRRSLQSAFVGVSLVFGLVPPTHAEPLTEAPEQTIKVVETGVPVQKCRALRSWITPERHQAFDVQAIRTKEIMTLVESGPADAPATDQGKVQVKVTSIFRWGRSSLRPFGAPIPPSGENDRCDANHEASGGWVALSDSTLAAGPSPACAPAQRAPQVAPARAGLREVTWVAYRGKSPSDKTPIPPSIPPVAISTEQAAELTQGTNSSQALTPPSMRIVDRGCTKGIHGNGSSVEQLTDTSAGAQDENPDAGIHWKATAKPDGARPAGWPEPVPIFSQPLSAAR